MPKKKPTPTPAEVFYAAERERREQYKAEEKASYDRRANVARAVHHALGSQGNADPSSPWFVFYKVDGPWTVTQFPPPGEGWTQGPEVKRAGWVPESQLVALLRDIVSPLPVTNDPI